MNRLQAMELFVSAVREGSFSAAGRRVGLSPASVSRALAELEASLGVQLLHRTSRSLSLTEAGGAYLHRVEAILHDIRDADALAASLHETPRGTLRVHSRVLFGLSVVVPLVPVFQQLCPDLKLELHLSENPEALRNDAIDIDLRIGPPRDPALMQRKVLGTERVVVASRAYLDRAAPLKRPADLMQHHCLTYWMGPEEVVWRFLRDGALEEWRVPSLFCTTSGQALRQLAVQGHGLALLDSYTVRQELADGRLTRVLKPWQVTNTTFETGIYAAFRAMPYTPAKISAFLDFLAAQAPVLVRDTGASVDRPVSAE